MHIEEAAFSLSCVLGSFVKDQLAIGEWVFYSDSFSLPVCFCANTMVFFVVILLLYSLKLDIVILPALDCLLIIASAI
jgi:hypothetical protein